MYTCVVYMNNICVVYMNNDVYICCFEKVNSVYNLKTLLTDKLLGENRERVRYIYIYI